MVNNIIRLAFLIPFFSGLATASNIDFDLYLTSFDQSKSIHISNNEIIPLEGDLQIKIYSKEEGFIDIFYESSEVKKSSLLISPLEIKAGQIITIPSEDESFKLELSPGNVSFELAFTSENETTLLKTNLLAFDSTELVKNSYRELISTGSSMPSENLPVYEIDKLNSDYSALIEINNRLSSNVINQQVLRGNSVYKKIAKGTVYIENYQNGEWLAYGSGVLLDEQTIITNLHVINNADKIYVATFGEANKESYLDYTVHNAEVLKISESKDLALLKTTPISDDINILDFVTEKNLEVGMNTHAVGHPDIQETWSYARGYISGIRKSYSTEYDIISFNGDVIQNATDIVPGFSGGPLTDDEGNIIGINSFGMPDGFEYAITTDEIFEFLKFPNNFNGWNNDNMSDSKNSENFSKTPEGYQCFDDDNNGVEEVCARDSEGDGYYESFYLDDDQDGTFDEFYLDENQNECDEIVITIGGSSKYPDSYDKYYYDLEDDNSGYDQVGHDTNNDGVIDEFQNI